ncbi:MAG: 50S ribosomal protein L22 [Parcubacteria group bacterium RIFCSPHIGHO2_01_FULL_45_26]|nr:ribosomal protein L22 [uncultured bacterium]OHB17557.1 MAG: 50S ribosomal protein L22 [Parcubacteria group bacterium RIFCSPHIGHO2_01_FULL_45_26]
MKASLNNYRQSPRKVRIVADLVRGRSVALARAELKHLSKRAASPLLKLIDSAVANSGNKDKLYIKNIQVDRGVILKRSRPRAMGRAFPIHKHTSHINLELGIKN